MFRPSMLLAAAAAFVSFSAHADWAKSYDWNDAKDQAWTAYDNGGKHYISAGGWEIEYKVVDGADINPYYVKTVGSSALLNFDTVERDTGLRVVTVGGFKQKTTLTEVIFPSSLTSVAKEAFHTSGVACDIVFPSTNAVDVGASAFYGTYVKSVAITAPGSIVQNDAFSGFDTWTGTSDLRGVVSIGDRAFSRGRNTYPVFTVVLSPALASIGGSAFNQQRGITVEYRYTLAELNSVSADITGSIGASAFSDNGAATGKFTLDIPFRGACTVGSKAFNWMMNCTNFFFWGAAPTLASDTFNSIGSGNSYKVRISGDPAMDGTGWASFATACTDGEKARADYPGDDVCLGTYTGNSGCVFWVCKAKSPYNIDTAKPVIEGVAVTRTADGCRVTGSLVQGSATITATFGDLTIPVSTGSVSAPSDFDVTIPIGSAAGAIPADWIGGVRVDATSGDDVATWTADQPFYTGIVSVECLADASEVRLAPGTFRVSRAASATGADLTIRYGISGTAVADQNYAALSGEVTIPAGASYADIVVRPIFDDTVAEDTMLVLALTAGANYAVSPIAGSATMTIANAAEQDDIYVDSMASAGGTGTEEAPFRTIAEGVAAVARNHTVYVMGGAGRVYEIAGDADRVVVTADKSGVTIRNWGDDLAPVLMTTKFDKTELTGAPFLVQAAGVTLKGLRFTYSYDSLSELSYNGVKYPIVRFAATAVSALMEDCEVVRGPWSDNANNNRYCTGQGGLIQTEVPFEARNCSFLSTRSDNLSYQFAVVCIANSSVGSRPATFTGCYFTNCTWIVESQSGRQNVTCVSNVFVNCESGFEAASNSGNPSDGLFRGAANGPDKLTLEYNIFYNDATMANKSKTLLQGCRETYNGGIVAHHNTVVGWDHFLSKSNIFTGNPTKAEVFDNLFVMNAGGSVYNEQWAYDKGQADVATTFKSGSFFRNNYVNCTINGGTLTQYSGYDFASNTTVSDNYTAPAPRFESLNSSSPKFCLMLQARNEALVRKNIAWTDNGAYPDYLGAVEPIVNNGLLLLFR